MKNPFELLFPRSIHSFNIHLWIKQLLWTLSKKLHQLYSIQISFIRYDYDSLKIERLMPLKYNSAFYIARQMNNNFATLYNDLYFINECI
jgi:hypothetical protein